MNKQLISSRFHCAAFVRTSRAACSPGQIRYNSYGQPAALGQIRTTVTLLSIYYPDNYDSRRSICRNMTFDIRYIFNINLILAKIRNVYN